MPMSTLVIVVIKAMLLFLLVPFVLSCSYHPKIAVSKLDLLQERTKFSSHGSHIEAIGMLSLNIDSEIDLIDYAVQRDLAIRFEIEGCKSGIEYSGWPHLFEVSRNEFGVTYQVIFDYKQSDNPSATYSLAISPEDLCFSMYMVDFIFPFKKSDKTRINLTEGFAKSLAEYEKENGFVKMYFSEECTDKVLCAPDYEL